MEMNSRLDPELLGPLETFLSLTGGGSAGQGSYHRGDHL